MRMRLSSALDENERLDNELVGQLVRQARVKSAATSPLKSRNTIEVREGLFIAKIKQTNKQTSIDYQGNVTTVACQVKLSPKGRIGI